jgi:predicted nucleotidyltransferase
MNMESKLKINTCPLHIKKEAVSGSQVLIDNESFYKIGNSDAMRPFFMSIVSESNHWMFISSNGGLSAGRKNSEYSLFPYYTDDKITESAEITGSKTILRVENGSDMYLWEPFSDQYKGIYNIRRNLYKNIFGNKVIFEEINEDLELTLTYQWNSSNQFGFVKRTQLTNHSEKDIMVEILDGIQNILPYGVTTELQNTRSNLVDAYKKSELLPTSGLGIYALSAIIVDKAEPSEALKANVAWSLGLKKATYLVSSLQVQDFREGTSLTQETDIRAEKGAYFVNAAITIKAQESIEWMIVANVNQSASDIADLKTRLKTPASLEKEVKADVEMGTKGLRMLAGAADGLQCTRDQQRTSRHYANVLYNIMRGGIFDHDYDVERDDLQSYMQNANKKVSESFSKQLEQLPEVFSVQTLRALSMKSKNADFQRLCLEYLPLKFSRRHGDPSRPWNKFSINTRSEVDGSKILDYEGNWRDIFQNWEALAHSYPEFIDSMIHKFLNASTFEGYNPYRVTKSGFDWEVIEPNDPWSYIGYWGDHQIIYLLKFLEFIEDYYPSRLAEYWDQSLFVYANVPYKIKSYYDTLADPKDTIVFDHELDHKINGYKEEVGEDGALLQGNNGQVYHVNLVEKLLATMLAKCSNFIPEAGIWLNTQRPEWNDANNALVGNGVSMVTLYYLRRFLVKFRQIVEKNATNKVEISEELAQFFKSVVLTLETHKNSLEGTFSDHERLQIMDGLGMAGSDYREQIYNSGYSGSKAFISKNELLDFTDTMLPYLEHSIDANQREDHLYHSYNLIEMAPKKGTSVDYLSVMLEGQVAVLSSGYLSPENVVRLLDNLKQSALYRKDQYSYILYPNKELLRFMDKNVIPASAVKSSELLTQLVKEGNRQILEQDTEGEYHFSGNFNNAKDLKLALEELETKSNSKLVNKEKGLILEIFEEVFDHKSFTGRSGTFFGYEGLGSIYWHMVSKLLLAVMECCKSAIEQGANKEVVKSLMTHFHEINEGIGVHKSPKLYGAFPTDPYSHTPATKGAQQPGMTGQVKEDILSRIAELGVEVRDGRLSFGVGLLQKEEILKETQEFAYIDLNNEEQSISLAPGSLAFTYCQTPVVYTFGSEKGTEILFKDGSAQNHDEVILDPETSTKVFQRTGEISMIKVSLPLDEVPM